MKVAIATSFSPQGYEVYGKKFLESYAEKWRGTTEGMTLHVFVEGVAPQNGGAIYHDLTDDREFNRFLSEFGHMAAAQGVIGKKEGKLIADYRYQAVKFGKKVFAYTSPGYVDHIDWWVWIDADVVFLQAPDEAFWNAVCPPDKLHAYLGRKDWDHCENGFATYRISHPVPYMMLKRLREFYETGEVFRLQEWHDSYVMDAVRAEYKHWCGFFTNLSDGVPGNHVWPETILGKYMEHRKGPELKMKAYGAAT